MDVDPLSESVPPRYAIESDEEEDEINPLFGESASAPTKYDINIVGDLPKSQTLVVASGDAGKFWAKGAELGEQTGAVFVNKVQVGLVFNPTWTSSTVIISEVLSKLPLSAMHPYASAILESLTPNSLAVLDTYPTPTYATDVLIPYHDAPIRYLTSETLSFPKSQAEPFAPPNLISSTSASFLTTTSSSTSFSRTLILLPSPHIPHAPPKVLSPSNFSQLEQDAVEWPAALINAAQDLVFHSLAAEGEEANTSKHTWAVPPSAQREKAPKWSTQIGEGGMYI
ncbi:hypothetical protein CVT25_009423 [Psilocybe cyanescens]|uniref:Uncharacterized protein n=1 Tax=Psilocybe cyanescens TaxID=93625 RepID=A0A409WVZ4_PSICY|nr:hypothetical protein CVT25_009423 [Psilocybe cyanescens]